LTCCIRSETENDVNATTVSRCSGDAVLCGAMQCSAVHCLVDNLTAKPLDVVKKC